MSGELEDHRRFFARPASRVDFGEEKWGVLFLNRGGPEATEDVEEYLYNLYSDPKAGDQSFLKLLKKPLARLRSSHRFPEIARRYEAIGGSPQLKWTRLIASGVKRELAKKYPHADVFVGMQYCEPFIHEELAAAVDEGCRHLVIFPMFPQYCPATTGAALETVEEWIDEYKGDLSLSLIGQWGNHPKFIQLLRGRVETSLEHVNRSQPLALLFVAQSIPSRVDPAEDPYRLQLAAMAEKIGEGFEHTLAFQAFPGSDDRVDPDAADIVRDLAKRGCRQVVVVPLSTVSDNICTLYNIDIRLKEQALAAGIEKFARIELLNDDSRFTAFLSEQVEELIEDNVG